MSKEIKENYLTKENGYGWLEHEPRFSPGLGVGVPKEGRRKEWTIGKNSPPAKSAATMET